MKKLAIGLLMVNGAAAALAADAGLTHYYGNTWELSRPEETIWIYANADGSWDGIFGGTFSAGLNWRTEGNRTCFFNPPGEKEDADAHGVCFLELGKRQVAEAWKQTVDGLDKVWDARIIKGRKVPPAAGTK